jgi:hypothetical protein
VFNEHARAVQHRAAPLTYHQLISSRLSHTICPRSHAACTPQGMRSHR